MEPYWSDTFANPSGAHAPARAARKAVDEARDDLADLLAAEPREIVFTAGGTEADNLAVFGTRHRPGGALCSAIEHHAVLEPVEACGGHAIAVDPTGRLDLDALEAALDSETSFVSVMLVNNETGIIQPLDEVARLVRRQAPNAYLHTDAVQALSWLDVGALAAGADLISLSAHKFGGPKGVGVLVARDRVDLRPLFLGGGQERELRSGTHNVAGIVGMAAAARAVAAERAELVRRVTPMRDRLLDGLLAAIDGAVETGGPDRSTRTAGHAHLCFSGIESESLLYLLEQGDVAASAASSCASGAMEPSHVLAAMGIGPETAAGSLRLTLGRTTTDSAVDTALEVVPNAVERLRVFA